VGRCPFHDDYTPSLIVTPGTNLWSCKGKCNIGGSTIDWVMKAQGVSFRHAVELLRADHPSLAQASGPVRISTVRKLAPPIARDAGDAEALLQVVEFYHRTLLEASDAQTYLVKRGLESSEMISRFRLGFANRTLGLRLPPNNRKAGAELRGRLQKLGILRESGHEHFNGCIVFPVFDRAGQVAEIYGRKIADDHLRAGTPLHLYLPGPHKGVWNEEALETSKEIILCEAIIDALTFWCAGYRNVTASYGVNGFTDDHRAALKKYGTRRVSIAYDRDEAGDKAATALGEELAAMDIERLRVAFPHGMDANEYARKVTPASKSLGILLNQAEWLGKPKHLAETPKTPEPVSVLAAGICSENAAPAAEPAPVYAAPPAEDLAIEHKDNGDILLARGDRRYRVRGLSKNLSPAELRINLMAWRGDSAHGDALNLSVAQQRNAFARLAAIELGVKEEILRRDLGKILLKLEELQDEQIRQALAPKRPEAAIAEGDRAAALDLLRDPRLLERVLEDFARCGVVGEETNKKVAYLAAVSRLMEAPLAVIVQSSSAAGKSSLMDAVLAFMPEEQRVEYSAMTGQSLFYMGETDLKNKILAIVEEEGAQRAAYALKLLQSEGALTIASTGKDPATGRLVTHQYRVEGPVMIFLTTTAIEVDEELLNRCLVLTVDEEREQTRAIHRQQREAQTLAGLLARRRRESVTALHRNAQRLLRPIAVVNPYARELAFPDSLTRTRRDHAKFLTLIRAATLLYQYQRPVQTAADGDLTVEYIESTAEDVRLAEELIRHALGRSLDELPPQTRRLLLLVDDMVASKCAELAVERADFRFSRRDVRHATGWSDAQLKRHLHKLEELEYLIVHRGGRGQSFVYELFFERPGNPAQPFFPGLGYHYGGKKYGSEAEKDGSQAHKDGPSTPQVRGMSGGGTGAPAPVTTALPNGFPAMRPENIDTGAQAAGRR
jgi:DNA primase catalytic core